MADPVLIIVDDAEVRDDLGDLLAGLHGIDQDADRPVRVLLLARDFDGDWWIAAQEPLREQVAIAEAGTHLASFGDEVPGQKVAADRAVRAFATELQVDVSPTSGTPVGPYRHNATGAAACRRPGGRTQRGIRQPSPGGRGRHRRRTPTP